MCLGHMTQWISIVNEYNNEDEDNCLNIVSDKKNYSQFMISPVDRAVDIIGMYQEITLTKTKENTLRENRRKYHFYAKEPEDFFFFFSFFNKKEFIQLKFSWYKVRDHSQGGLEGSLFNSYYTEV